MFKRLIAVGLTLFAGSAVMAQDRPQVVVVNYPLQYVAERLLGDDADVVFPVPNDVDPSFWRPSIADISMIQSADLILLNGAGFATWIDRVSLPRSKVVNTAAGLEDQFIFTESITHSHGEGEEHSHEGLASYLWLDLALALAQAQAVADALIARGVLSQDAVTPRLDALRADLEQLDAEARTATAGLQGATLITTHPRYQYLARRYDLTMASLEWEAGAMPTDADLADLETLIAQTDARLLVWEAEPPAAAFDATQALGVQNVVFPTLAHAADGAAFTQSYADGLEGLALAPTE